MNEALETVVPGLSGNDYQASYGDGPYDFAWFKYDKMNFRPYTSGAAPKPKKPPKGGSSSTTTTVTGAVIKYRNVISFLYVITLSGVRSPVSDSNLFKGHTEMKK